VKNISLFIIVLISLIINSCKNDPVAPPLTATSGNLVVTSNPSGAAIYLQGNFTGRYTPDTLKNVAFGSYAVKLKFNNTLDSTFNFEVKAGGVTNISIDLTNSVASLIIDSDPRGCEIYLNGAPSNKITPDTIKFINIGRNTLTLIKDKLVLDSVINVNKGQNNIFLNYNGTAIITSTPSGAKIIIDGVNTNKVTPDSVKMMNGSHKLELSTSDYYFATQISIKPGGIIMLDHSFIAPGNISVNSYPAGANIWLDGTNTGKTTPTVLQSINIGSHTIVLNKANYVADTINVIVLGSQTINVGSSLLASASLQEFGPVTLYYGSGLTISQPNALVLSTGVSSTFSSLITDSVDLVATYYYIESAEYYYTGRYTYFYQTVTGTNNLYDGVPSVDISSGNWSQELNYSNTSYFFIYDTDHHFSKMIITEKGGSGTTSSPYYIKVKWLYNKVAGDKRFQ